MTGKEQLNSGWILQGKAAYLSEWEETLLPPPGPFGLLLDGAGAATFAGT